MNNVRELNPNPKTMERILRNTDNMLSELKSQNSNQWDELCAENSKL